MTTTISLANISPTPLKADMHVLVPSPADGSYTIALKTSTGGTISSINVITSSGSCSVAVRINGANVVWPSSATTVAATTSINEKAAASSNSFGIGAKIELVVSSSSTPENLAVTIAYTRTA